jgi:anti-sigma B factor antagonist
VVLLEIERLAGQRRFVLRGELDAATAVKLTTEVEPVTREPGDVELELSGLSFCDSTGLRALLQLAKGLDGKGVLVLRNPTANLRRLLEITGVEGRANLRAE